MKTETKPQHTPTPLIDLYDGASPPVSEEFMAARLVSFLGISLKKAQLIVRAVNEYDRLKRIEEKAKLAVDCIATLKERNEELLAAAKRVRSVLNDEGKEVLSRGAMEDLLFQAITRAEAQ